MQIDDKTVAGCTIYGKPVALYSDDTTHAWSHGMDAELIKAVGGLLSGVFEHMNNHTDFTPLYFERVAKELFALILPVLSARLQKKLQEIVEQARIEERKAIRKWMEEHKLGWHQKANGEIISIESITSVKELWESLRSGAQPKTTAESSKVPKK